MEGVEVGGVGLGGGFLAAISGSGMEPWAALCGTGPKDSACNKDRPH